MSETQYGYARRECTIHSQLKDENVVELYDYTESKSEFVLLMEYCNDANYFQEKIEEVRMPYRINCLEAYSDYESGEAAVVCVRYAPRPRLHTLVRRHS